MNYSRACLTDEHVLQKYMYYEGHVLLKVMFYNRICLTGEHVDIRTGLTGWHTSHQGMHYWRTCIREGYSHCLSVQHLL